tara:strand:- start:65 stop:1270 length:1206 start_codon:yes stop_codon:yes gene_type:complete
MAAQRKLNLQRRADLKVLNNPTDARAFNAAMKASNAIYGAQGHHLFDQQELIRAFQGRSKDAYFRVIKKLNDIGIVVNDSANQIIPAYGDQTKGTVHKKIHDQVRILPKTDYSKLTEKQLVEELTQQALKRKRIAASTLDSSLTALVKADPTLASLPGNQLVKWIKAFPEKFHKLTKDAPVDIPTEQKWPEGAGGKGTISIKNKPRLKSLLSIGKGAGANAQYFDLGTGAAMAWSANSLLNPQSAEAASSMLAGGANKEDTAKFFKGIGNDLKGQLTIAAASKLLNGAGTGVARGVLGKAGPLLIGWQGKQLGDAILRGAVGEDLKSQGEIAEAGKKYRKAIGWSNKKSSRQNQRHSTGLKVNREMIDDYNLTHGKNDSEFYENYRFNLAMNKLMRESKKA